MKHQQNKVVVLVVRYKEITDRQADRQDVLDRRRNGK